MPVTELIVKAEPQYLQLRDIIRRQIEAEEFPPGTMLPSENELAKQHGLNRLTVRSAIDGLVEEGLVRRVQGKGAYVLGEVEFDVLDEGRFQPVPLRGGSHSTRVLSSGPREAGPKFAQLFGIVQDSDIWVVRLVKLIAGVPFRLEEHYVPISVAPGFASIDLKVFTLFGALEFCGAQMQSCEQRMYVAEVSARQAGSLKIANTDQVLWLEEWSRDADGRLLVWSAVATVPDRCRMKVSFTR